jgi:hypothetical protein
MALAIYGVVDRMNIPEMALAATIATNLGSSPRVDDDSHVRNP